MRTKSQTFYIAVVGANVRIGAGAYVVPKAMVDEDLPKVEV